MIRKFKRERHREGKQGYVGGVEGWVGGGWECSRRQRRSKRLTPTTRKGLCWGGVGGAKDILPPQDNLFQKAHW